jgi:hypothetical protein
MKNYRAICLLVCLLAVVLAPRISQAGTISIPVTGSGQIQDQKGDNAFLIGGSGFTFFGISGGSNGVYCVLDTQCVATTQGDVSGQWSYRGYSGLADVNISFVSDPFTIHSPSPTGPIPALFTGDITGFSGDFIIGTIAGTGTIDLTDVDAADSPLIYFLTAGFSFDGSATLTATPEPGSLVLAGSGMLALLGAVSRKARAKRCR